MKRNFDQLLQKLTASLHGEELEPDALVRLYKSMEHVESAISEMKQQIAEFPFEGARDEIEHFKKEAPEIYSKLFFFMHLTGIESSRTYTGIERFKILLQRELQTIDSFFEKHDSICQYFSSSATHQDEYFFLRRAEGEWINFTTYIPADFTIGAYLISCIKANTRLRTWLQTELMLLDTAGAAAASRPKKQIQWKRKRVEFIEVFTALFLEGCFGDIPLKDLMEWGEWELGVKVGQHHVAIYEISTRKEGLTIFLNKITQGLIDKIHSLLKRNKQR